MRGYRHALTKKRTAIVLFLFALLIGGGILWGRPFLDVVLRDLLINQLSQRLQATVSIGTFSLSILPPRMEAEGIEIKRSSGPLRYIGVGRATIVPGAGPIFLGKIVIRQVEIERPQLRFDLTDATMPAPSNEGKFHLPTLKDLLRVDIENVTVHSAKLSLKLPGQDIRVLVDTGQAGFKGGVGGELWSWNASGEIRRGSNTLRLDQVSILAEREGSRIRLKKFDAEGLGTSVHIEGDAYPQADLFMQVRGELEPVEAALRSLGVFSKPMGAKGKVRAEGRVKGNWPDVKWSGEFRGIDLELLHRKIIALSFSFRLRREKLEAASGEINVDGTPGRFTVGEIAPGYPGVFSIQANDVSYAAIQRTIDPTLTSSLSGNVNINVSGRIGFSPLFLVGEAKVTAPLIHLDLAEAVRPYLPFEFHEVEVNAKYHVTPSLEFLIDECSAKANGLEGTYSLSVQKGPTVSMKWTANIRDLSQVFSPNAHFRGSATLGGGANYNKYPYNVLLKLAAQNFQVGDRLPASLSGDILVDRERMELRQFRMKQGHSTMMVESTIPRDSAETKDGFSVRVDAKDFDLGWLSDLAAKRFPQIGKMDGVVSGRLVMSGSQDQPNGVLEVRGESLSWRNQAFDHADIEADFVGGAISFRKGELKSESATLSVKGDIGATSFHDFQIEGSQIPLSMLNLPPWIYRFASHASGSARLEGKLEDPTIQSAIQFQRKEEGSPMGIIGTGDASGNWSNLLWKLNLLNGTLQAEGKVNGQTGDHFEASGKASQFSLAPLLPRATSLLTGTFAISGNPKRNESWEGGIDLEQFNVSRGDWKAALENPIHLGMERGVISLQRAKWIGSDTSIEIGGNLSMPKNRMDVHLSGAVALDVLTFVDSGVNRTEGDAKIEATVSGPLSSPEVAGDVVVTNGLIQFRGFPHPIERIELHATLDQQRIFVDQLKASLAGGAVTGGGEVNLPFADREGSFALEARVDHAQLRFPAWIPSNVSGTLSLVGALNRPTLRGDLVAHEATYREDWDWKSRVLTFRSGGRLDRMFRSEEEHVAFDLLIRSEGDTLFLHNNIATATMRGEIRLTGTDRAVGVLGRIDVIRGKVEFLDNEFEVSSGVITFESPTSVRTLFDLSARTRVQTTDILLDIRNEKDEVMAFLSSQPPKDETNILSLLTLGVDMDELVNSGNGGSQAFSNSLLPSVLSSPVQSKLESGLRKASIVDTLQFVPFYSDDTKSTGLKMIIGKQLFPKVRVFYSTDLISQGSENVLRLEQRLNDHISVQGSMRDKQTDTTQEFGVGLDLEFKTEF